MAHRSFFAILRMMNSPIVQISVGGLDDNFAYLIHDGTKAGIVDPSGDAEKIHAAIEKAKVEPVAILITHTHGDHIDQLDDVRARYKTPVWVHRYGLRAVGSSQEHVEAIDEGDTISIGDLRLSVLHTPGHCPDAVCYYLAAERSPDHVPHLITGDTLFVERVGRTTDAHVDELYESVQRLVQLPDETMVYSGHDYGRVPRASLSEIKRINPYLKCSSRDAFRELRLAA